MLFRDTTALNDWNTRLDRKPLILRGARQVGKSTLVRMFAKEKGLQLAEINLERHPLLNDVFGSFKLDHIVSALEAVCGLYLDDSKTLLFLDEVQATPDAIAALRYFYEDRPNLRVIAAGSLLEFVLADHNFSMPVGRVEFHWLRPMTFNEFLLARGEDFLADRWTKFKPDEIWPETLHQKLWEQYRWYVVIGGMPEAVAAFAAGQNEKRIQNIHDSITASYAADFAKYAKQSELMRLQTVYRRLPKYLGIKVKYSSILEDTKTEAIKRAVNLLTMAGIVQKVFYTNCAGTPLRSNTDERIFKLFWLDIGLLGRMMGVNWLALSAEPSLSIEGLLAEQFVAQELLAADQSMDPAPLCYWIREGKIANAEVDFVIQKDREIVPIEVKSGSPGSFKSMAQLVSKAHLKRAVRLSNVLPLSQRQEMTVIVDGQRQSSVFTLVNLPLYFAGKLNSILEQA